VSPFGFTGSPSSLPPPPQARGAHSKKTPRIHPIGKGRSSLSKIIITTSTTTATSGFSLLAGQPGGNGNLWAWLNQGVRAYLGAIIVVRRVDPIPSKPSNCSVVTPVSWSFNSFKTHMFCFWHTPCCTDRFNKIVKTLKRIKKEGECKRCEQDVQSAV
jgi:hypothetical protein